MRKGGDISAVLTAGLPEIKGNIITYPSVIQEATGVFAQSFVDNKMAIQSNGSAQGYGHIMFNASDSEPIYGNSDTVQPPALCLIPQIKF